MQASILQRQSQTDEQPPKCVLVAGATGGIGSAFCRKLAQRFPECQIVRLARDPYKLEPLDSDTIDIPFELDSEPSIQDAVDTLPSTLHPDWVFGATGCLCIDDYRPEKTYKSLDAEYLMKTYRINTIGPALLLKHLIPRLNPARYCRIGLLSARVGSVSDNRLGGWHAYRASKAALNMLVKNFAIELARKKSPHLVVGLQPGTTNTALSAPFQRNVPEGQLQTPEYTADQLVKVMLKLDLEDSGGLFDFLGIPFAP